VLRGDVQLYFSPIPGAKDLILTSKLKAVAVNSARRVPQLPDVPTVAEAGLKDYKYDSWFAVLAPAGTPTPVRQKVSRDITAILKMPEVSEKLLAQGAFPVTNTPQEFDAILRNDTLRYEKMLKDAGVEPQ
jgi:tripartite-type tricarboxylate transporter receptor subunit TctC